MLLIFSELEGSAHIAVASAQCFDLGGHFRAFLNLVSAARSMQRRLGSLLWFDLEFWRLLSRSPSVRNQGDPNSKSHKGDQGDRYMLGKEFHIETSCTGLMIGLSRQTAYSPAHNLPRQTCRLPNA